jgi:hypothetical protein
MRKEIVSLSKGRKLVGNRRMGETYSLEYEERVVLTLRMLPKNQRMTRFQMDRMVLIIGACT